MRRNPARRSVRERQTERDFARLHLRVGRAFGPHIRKLRARARMSQGDLAGERYDRSFIAKLEAGDSLPSLDALEILAEALELRLRALIPPKL